jgi:putative sterol carrier protein
VPDTRDSVPADELAGALAEYVDKANASPRAARTLAGWSCRIHIRASDVPGAAFTLVVDGGKALPIAAGNQGAPDLIVTGHSMDLAEIFWGDANPASSYMQGAITSQGRADDIMRLDAMALFVFLGQ